MAEPKLDPCPFCGNEPSFGGDAGEWMDESRYVEMTVDCCVTMREAIGWRRARDMTPGERQAELKGRLAARWNGRHSNEESGN